MTKQCKTCKNQLDLSAFNDSDICMGCENFGKVTRERIHEEFEGRFLGKNPSGALSVAMNGIVDFYDTKIQKLLEEIVLCRRMGCGCGDYGCENRDMGFEEAIQEIKANIKKTGF